MSADFIRRVVERFYADIWNRHDLSTIEALLHPGFTFRSSLNYLRVGHKGFAAYVDFIHEALGEYECNLLDLVVESPKAFARLRFSGIHQGEFLGYPATGMPVEWIGCALFTFKGEKITDLWVLGDIHELLQRLDRNAQSASCHRRC